MNSPKYNLKDKVYFFDVESFEIKRGFIRLIEMTSSEHEHRVYYGIKMYVGGNKDLGFSLVTIDSINGNLVASSKEAFLERVEGLLRSIKEEEEN